MIVETARRFAGVRGNVEYLAPVVIAGEIHAGLVREQLAAAGISPAQVILEPQGRNTAATAALAALVAQEIDPTALVLLMPADHVITDVDAFAAAVERACAVVDDYIVTFGMTPDRPETGYGYIRRGEMLADGVFAVAKFTEKPVLEVAQGYLAEGGHDWNSGVFFFRPDVLLGEFRGAAEAIREGAMLALRKAVRQGVEVRLDRAAFAATPAHPVDVAVMEETKRAAVAPCNIGWADVGSWYELWRLSPKDDAQNAATGSVKLLEAHGNLVLADGIHVSVAGVSDLIIVATRDAVLVLPKDRAQDVKKLIPGPG